MGKQDRKPGRGVRLSANLHSVPRSTGGKSEQPALRPRMEPPKGFRPLSEWQAARGDDRPSGVRERPTPRPEWWKEIAFVLSDVGTSPEDQLLLGLELILPNGRRLCIGNILASTPVNEVRERASTFVRENIDPHTWSARRPKRV